MILQRATDKLFKSLDYLDSGTLKLITPDGRTRVFAGKNPGETVCVELRNWNVVTNMLRKGDIGFAQDYHAGNWETNNLTALVTLGLVNRGSFEQFVQGHKLSRLLTSISYLFRINSLRGSKKNIKVHYDLGNEFYQLWLDYSMTYSSAIFTDPLEPLKKAQDNKYERILGCLKHQSGSLLEVGCGWGGFAQRAYEYGDYDIKGITLSKTQLNYAQKRLGKKALITLEDYRHQQGKYNHIVSIEMFEAVGERYWSTYFNKLASLLSKRGKAVIQTITINDKEFPSYRKGGDFIRSFIFPGGMLCSPSRFRQEAQKAGLKTSGAYFFGQNYALTLEHWLNTFDKKTEQIKALGFDEGFIRLWRFYLAGCIAGFKTERTDVMQIELSHA